MNATDCAFLPLAGQGSLLWSTAALLSEAATRHTWLLKRKLVTTNNSVPQAHPSHVKSTETTCRGTELLVSAPSGARGGEGKKRGL